MAVCGDPAGVAAYQYVVYIALGAVILATPFIAVMHYGNDKPAAVMAAAAGDVVQLLVGKLTRFGIELFEICFCALCGHFDAVFLGKRQQLFRGLCGFCLFNKFGCKFVFHKNLLV